MGDRADSPAAVLSLPDGGGSQAGIGASFRPDPFTGTGNIGLSITAPAGRLGLGPDLSLGYSTGAGNGPFGLGWSLGPGRVARKTSLGIPTYDDATDVFVLDGADDLVPAGGGRYRPRTDRAFARVAFDNTAWTVEDKSGLTTRYDFALASPTDPAKVFAWHPTRLTDTFGNHIAYDWTLDARGHAIQAYLDRVRWCDHGDPAEPSYLAEVRLVYADRPDPFSDRRAGFEISTRRRCTAIEVWAADPLVLTSRYDLTYDDTETVALLVSVTRTGFDGDASQALPPTTFGYSSFDVAARTFRRVTGEAPPASLGDPSIELVDLFGNGLLDVVEVSGATRYWRNLGDGTLAPVRTAPTTPGGYALGEPGVQLLDANGDGRADLVVSTPQNVAGYFPLGDGGWDPEGFQRWAVAPSVDLKAPDVRLVDLTGNGVTDALRMGARFECFFNDPRRGWTMTSVVERSRLDGFPDVGFDDPRVQLADMTGDGLQDVVVIAGNDVSYWPSLGYGRFGPRVRMVSAPMLPTGYAPARLLLGDVDGDGTADLAYVGADTVTVWRNHGGNRYGPPVTVTGTPVPADAQGLRVVDLLGTGTAGILWSRPATATPGATLFFLDLCGGRKPYLLERLDNAMGATTEIEYRSSIVDYLRDEADEATRWRTTLPFPVHVVGSLTVHETFSASTRTTSYRYRHGYWDGVEREFRGFGRVDQLDAATGDDPVETRTWFDLGPVGGRRDWRVLSCADEFWPGDPDALPVPPLPDLDANGRRDAARSLRGTPLRSEAYALDGSAVANRPHWVAETAAGTRVEQPPTATEHGVFFPHETAERRTHWERGADPLTQATFTDDYDAFGQPLRRLVVGVPRGRDYRVPGPAGAPYLAFTTADRYAGPSERPYVADRVALRTTYDAPNDGSLSLLALHAAVLDGTLAVTPVAQHATYYDGPAFEGLPLGALGSHGAPVRDAEWTWTAALLRGAWAADGGAPVPPYLAIEDSPPWTPEYPEEFRAAVAPLAGYRYDDGTGPTFAGYWTDTTRVGYDFQAGVPHPRGMTIATRDPLGKESTSVLDAYQLFTAEVRHPHDVTSTWEHDYRVMAPRLTTDANGNRTRVTYSPLGDVASRAVMGRPGADVGDTPEQPSSRWTTDYLAFVRDGLPVSITAVEREHHAHDTHVPLPGRDRTITTVSYLDGCGRSLQSRTQGDDVRFGDAYGDGVLPPGQDAPPMPAVGRKHQDSDLAWVVVSGRLVYDAKGRVVEVFQPYRAEGWAYDAPLDGARVTSRFDPLGREVERIHPDGSRRRTCYGVPRDVRDPGDLVPTPWETWFYDANDLGVAADAGTPTTIVVDALHRPVRSIERLSPDPAEEQVTAFTHDIRGNLLSVVDPVGRTAFRYLYDLANRPVRVESVDAGLERTIRDAAGLQVEYRAGTFRLDLHVRDVLQRPSRSWARDVSAATTLREWLVYGDDPASGLDRAAALAANCVGRLRLQHDEAGLDVVDAYDFKGNVAERTRRTTARGDAGEPGPRPWEDLDPETYRTSGTYDALNRPTLVLTPAGADGARTALVPRYGRGGALAGYAVDGVDVVTRIASDVLGRLTLVAYAAGAMSRWANDSATQRPVRLRSETCTVTEDATTVTYAPTGAAAFQDYAYRYDAIGNIVALSDRMPGCGTPADPGRLERAFGYDALYRLRSATGREAPPVATEPWQDPPRAASVTVAAAYTETYDVDACDNLRRVAHAGTYATETAFALVDGSNRLASYTTAGTTRPCAYDDAGNLVSDAPGRRYAWGMGSRLTGFTGADGTAVWHAYDVAARRVKTVVTAPGGGSRASVWIGGWYERHRDAAGVRTAAHVTNGGQRVVSVWTEAEGTRRVEHVLADHLGSSNVLLDGDGAETSREEYGPYGTTTFGGAAGKEYRYVDRRLDEPSGLYDFGARWYAPWLGRWATTDPMGAVDGGNLYAYVGANPVTLHDPTGTNGKSTLPPALPPPPFPTLDPLQSEVVQLYGYVSDPDKAYALNLTDRLMCQIHLDPKLTDTLAPSRWPAGLQREVWDVFERVRPLHFGSTPALRSGWEDLTSSYTGSKHGAALYSATRSPGYSRYLTSASPIDFKTPSWVRPPEVHHLLYKALYPEFAVEPWNLMLTTRGNSSVTGQHEMMHMVSAATKSDIYRTLVPATRELIKSWAGQTASYYPVAPERSVVPLWSASREYYLASVFAPLPTSTALTFAPSSVSSIAPTSSTTVRGSGGKIRTKRTWGSAAPYTTRKAARIQGKKQ